MPDNVGGVVMNKAGLMIVLMVLLCSIIAGAVAVVEKGADVSLCPRQTGLITEKVMGDRSEAVSVSLSGAASSWATAVPSGFSIVLGEEKLVYVYVTPKKTASPGNYGLNVLVNGLQFNHNIMVRNCYGANLQLAKPKLDVCSSESADYELNIVNVGEYAETYDLSVEGQIKDSVSLGESSVTLNPGASKKIYAKATAPDKPGVYSFSIAAVGKSGNSVGSADAELNAKPCYDFSVDVGGDTALNFCEHVVYKVPVLIENKGTSTNEFKIYVKGPEWAKPSRNSVTLAPKESFEAELVLNPGYGVYGNFDVGMEVIPLKGSLKATSDFDVSVRKCHSVSVDIVDESAVVCSNGETSSYDIIVKNDGEFDKNLKLELTAPDWVKSEHNSLFILRKGVEEKVVLKASPGASVIAGNYEAKVKVSATDDSKAFGEDSIKLEVFGVNECFKPTIESTYSELVIFEDSSVSLPIVIKNEGEKRAVYDIVLSGSADFVSLNPSAAEVEPGKTATAYLYIAPAEKTPLQSYSSTVSVKLKDSGILASKEFKIRITGDESEATKLSEVKESNWQKLKRWFFGLFKKKESVSSAAANASAAASPIGGKLEKAWDWSEYYWDNYKKQIIIGIIAVLAILVLIRVGFFKKLFEFFEEDVEDEFGEESEKDEDSSPETKEDAEEEPKKKRRKRK